MTLQIFLLLSYCKVIHVKPCFLFLPGVIRELRLKYQGQNDFEILTFLITNNKKYYNREQNDNLQNFVHITIFFFLVINGEYLFPDVQPSRYVAGVRDWHHCLFQVPSYWIDFYVNITFILINKHLVIFSKSSD